jgi:hypothetical protein
MVSQKSSKVKLHKKIVSNSIKIRKKILLILKKNRINFYSKKRCEIRNLIRVLASN